MPMIEKLIQTGIPGDGLSREQVYQRFLSKLQTEMNLPEQTVLEAVNGICGPYKLSPKMERQREERREISQNAREKAANFAADYQMGAANIPEQADGLDRYVMFMMDRSADPQAAQRNREFADIMKAGTPEQRGRAVKEKLLAYKEFSPEKLVKMEPQQIIDNFGELYMMATLSMEADNIKKGMEGNPPYLVLDEETRQIVENMQAAQKYLPVIKNKMDIYTSPYYELLDENSITVTDTLAFSDGLENMGAVDGDDLLEWASFCSFYGQNSKTLGLDMENRMFRAVLDKNIFPTDARYWGADGEELFYDKGKDAPDRPPHDRIWDRMRKGEPIHAVMPETGEVLRFEGGKEVRLRDQDAAEVMKRAVNYGSPKSRMEGLLRRLEDTDSAFLFTNSSQFKQLKSALKDFKQQYKPLGPNPTEAETQALKQLFTRLRESAKDYSTYKTNEKPSIEERNDRENKRLAVAREVEKMAGEYLKRIGALNKVTEQVREAMAGLRDEPGMRSDFGERIHLINGKKTGAGGKTNQELIEEHVYQVNAFQRAPDQNGAVRTLVGEEEERQNAVTSYYIKPGNSRKSDVGESMNELRRDILQTCQTNPWLFRANGNYTEEQKAQAYVLMAKMVTYSLLLQERYQSGALSNSVFSKVEAGPLEAAFQSAHDAAQGSAENNSFVSQIADSKIFSDLIGDITPVRFHDFVTNSGAKTVGNKLLGELAGKKEPEKNGDELSAVQKGEGEKEIQPIAKAGPNGV